MNPINEGDCKVQPTLWKVQRVTDVRVAINFMWSPL